MTEPEITKWTLEVEELLEKLRINCVNLSEYHRKRYYHFKGYGKYFRLPLIILASVNATASVGLQPLMGQQIISGITCLIGMTMGIIGSVELYLGIQTSMELELKQSKEFYTISIDLFKMLSLRRENRSEDGKDYLNKRYGDYIKLCEASNLLRRKLLLDTLTEIPPDTVDKSPTGSNVDTTEYQRDLPLYKQPRPSIEPSEEMEMIELMERGGVQEREVSGEDI
tara:strand:+ start:723 stop:1397 length:675 start_codon:yes stop_codon:yes gene_type:complete